MIVILDTDAAFQALEPEWWALWRRTPGTTPFQSPAWLLPWWRAFGTGQPRVATFRRDGVLVAMLAMYVLDEGGGRKMLPVGAGTTDYLDALGMPAGPLVGALRDRARAEALDSLDLFDVPPWSALLDLDLNWADGTPCPVLTLPHIPPGIRRKLRMNRNRADRAGGVTVDAAGPDMLPVLIRLHQARWTAQDEPGALSDPAVLRFHHDALPRLHAAGLLRFQVLRLGGAVIAAILALRGDPDRVFFYLSGFDDAQSFISPGTILLGSMLEQAAAEGRTEAHFLRGREGYKYAWGAVDRVNRCATAAC